jgi:uroporphyrinogen decarboxylase
MTSRELVVKTLNHQPVPRTPRDLWLPAGEDPHRADELAEMNIRYPSDIVQPEAGLVSGKRSQGKSTKAGDYTDAWGCVWHNDPGQTAAVLKRSPLAEADKIAAYKPPMDLLDRTRLAKVNKSCQATNRFVLAWSEVRPFDRLRFLRGDEAAIVDIARDTKETRDLLAMLHDFACKEIELWAATEVDGVVLRDDWGTADGLLIAPEMWREIFRPFYREYCKQLHAQDKFVFFHSRGNIRDIFGDLIKAGVDAIHAETHLMDLERLAKHYRGRVTFWGAMDPQRLREPGSTDDFRRAVLAVRKALDYGSGGVIAQCCWEADMPLRTVAAFFEQWLAPVPMHV